MTSFKIFFQLYTLTNFANFVCSSPIPSSSCVPLPRVSASPPDPIKLISNEIHVLENELGYSMELNLYGVNKTFNLFLDTSSSVTFVGAQNCEGCGNHSTASTTASPDGTPPFSFKTLLGDGIVDLSLSKNITAEFEGIRSNLSLYAATKVDNFTAAAPFDGIYGLAIDTMLESTFPNIIQQLASEGRISSPTLTLQLPPISSANAVGLALFGDATSFLSVSTRVTQQNASFDGLWGLQVVPSINGSPIFATNSTRTARLNTKQNRIGIPESDMQALITALPGAQASDGGVTLLCTAKPNISFNIGEVQLLLKPEHIMSDIKVEPGSSNCFTRLSTLNDDEPWSLGSPFTNSFVISLDYGTNSITVSS